jgi:hypothetical protein
MDGLISPDEDVVLAQRYGADYFPQTEAGRKAQAAAIAAAPNAAVSTFWRDPCPGPSLTARAACANDLRDKAAIENKFPWMDLVYTYDAKILQASAEADVQQIKSDEFLARVKAAGDELQAAITQRVQATQAQTPAQQASQRRAVLLPPAATGCSVADNVATCTNN